MYKRNDWYQVNGSNPSLVARWRDCTADSILDVFCVEVKSGLDIVKCIEYDNEPEAIAAFGRVVAGDL